jgi:hypothetical protein
MAWVEKRGNLFRVRCRLPNGTVATDSSHPTKTAAKTRAADLDTDQRRDVFINPGDGKITLHEWVTIWTDAHDVGRATWARYRSHLDLHILPRFGDTPLAEINRMAVKTWVKDLNRRRAPATVANILTLFSSILNEAVEDRRIPANPCRRLRGATPPRPERPWATAAQVHTNGPARHRPQPHTHHHRRLHRHALGRTGRTSTTQLQTRRHPHPHRPRPRRPA